MPATATINGTIVAQTDTWETADGNIYFPHSAVNRSYTTSSSTTTICPWKGTARYYNLAVDGTEIKDAAWYYPETVTEKAEPIRDHVAFYKGKVDVKVVD